MTVSSESGSENQGKPEEGLHKHRLLTLIPLSSFGYAAIYNLSNVIYDSLLIPNYILGAFATLILFGYVKKKGWTIWASIAYAPLVLAETIPTFQTSAGLSLASPPVLVFQISLIAFAATSLVSAILIIFDRSRFKQRTEPQPERGQ